MKLDWNKLVWYSDEELSRLDIAAVNLACAADLPGAEQIDEDRCLFTLDYWARTVKRYTEQHWRQFRRKRYDYHNSEPYFRMLCLITVLQRDMGVHYNPDKIPAEAVFDTADSFIHGVIQGPGGTCATMPVVYAAVGRRLGYPLKLVEAKGEGAHHGFARWDEGNGKWMNIEATSGFGCPPDDHYRTGRYALTPEHEEAGLFLKSKTPKQELASFLVERAHRWRESGNQRQCVDSFACASALVPENQFTVNTLKIMLNEWTDQLEPLKPPGFPAIDIVLGPRRYPETLPFAFEHHIRGLATTENLLKDPRFIALWWEPLRQGRTPAQRVPAKIVAEFDQKGCCNLRIPGRLDLGDGSQVGTTVFPMWEYDVVRPGGLFFSLDVSSARETPRPDK
jgi:hypothetical protein